jgi:hypothetical protein
MPRLLSTSAESTTITTVPRAVRKPTLTASAGVRPCQPRRGESPWCYLSSCQRIDHKIVVSGHRRVGSTQFPRKPPNRYFVSGVCVARDGCARFGSHLLSPDVTSGVPAAAGVLIGGTDERDRQVAEARVMHPGNPVISARRCWRAAPVPGPSPHSTGRPGRSP